MANDLLFVFLGFFILAVGADLLIRALRDAAFKMHVPALLIGISISIATSAPEALLMVEANRIGIPDIATYAILGSTILNLLFILGLGALLISPRIKMSVRTNALRRDAFVLLLATGALFYFANTEMHHSAKGYIISRPVGLVFIAAYLIYFGLSVFMEVRAGRQDMSARTSDAVSSSGILPSWLTGVAGAAMMLAGVEVVIFGALGFIDEGTLENYRTVGLFILALGVAFPELVAVIFAAIRKESPIVFGTVLGSSIGNILFALGIGAAIPAGGLVISHGQRIVFGETKFDLAFFKTLPSSDVSILLLASIAATFFMFTGRKVSMIEALILIAAYGVFVWFNAGPLLEFIK